jgi:hypothetical protein
LSLGFGSTGTLKSPPFVPSSKQGTFTTGDPTVGPPSACTDVSASLPTNMQGRIDRAAGTGAFAPFRPCARKPCFWKREWRSWTGHDQDSGGATSPMPVRNQLQIIKSAHGTQTQKAQCKRTPDQESHGTHHQECPSYSYKVSYAIATPNCIMSTLNPRKSEGFRRCQKCGPAGYVPSSE